MTITYGPEWNLNSDVVYSRVEIESWDIYALESCGCVLNASRASHNGQNAEGQEALMSSGIPFGAA